MRNNSLSISRRKRIITPSPKKKRRLMKKKKKQTQGCIDSITPEIYTRKVSNFFNKGVLENEAPNQTIDLCDDESLIDSIGIEKVENDFPLNNDKTKQTEVIDLTENAVVLDASEHVENVEPTVIELSEDEEKEEPNQKAEASDDIFVIGTFSKTPKSILNEYKRKKKENFGPLSCRSNKINSLNNLKIKLKNKWKSRKKMKNVCQEIFVKRLQSDLNLSCIGENIYSNSSVALPQSGLRPIIIDGSNVAFVHTNHNFSCKRLEICIKYFKEKGHKVTAFVPEFRTEKNKCDNPKLLKKLEEQGDVILTPSKEIDGRHVVPYDDRFIVQTAVLKGGIIVSRDKFKDLLIENPAWAVTIKYRTLAFTWVDNVVMFPKDPLGKLGPSLEEFLRF